MSETYPETTPIVPPQDNSAAVSPAVSAAVSPAVKSRSLMVISDPANETPVSSELKTMVPSAAPAAAAPAANPVNKILCLSTAALSAVVVCLSIAIARQAGIVSTEVVNVDKPVPAEGVFATMKPPPGDNICKGKEVYLPNIECVVAQIDDEPFVNGTRFFLGTAEQSGTNVTKGYQGDLEVTSVPIGGPYFNEGLCPVNVHWHLGTEHLSVGQYDEDGDGPKVYGGKSRRERQLAGEVRKGYQCHHYDETDSKFTKEYDWKHCVHTHVGETYEVHWPHSNMGACGTPNQYQSPFYDGVFCRYSTDFGSSLANAKIGVQGQIFTIVNDESYYYPDLIRGMIVDGDKGEDIATYTGSTTGTSRNNTVCSQYTSITWQVDRKCHLISASSFDKMCADMAAQRDDMSIDFYPHGSRELVADHLAANNQYRRTSLRKIGN